MRRAGSCVRGGERQGGTWNDLKLGSAGIFLLCLLSGCPPAGGTCTHQHSASHRRLEYCYYLHVA